MSAFLPVKVYSAAAQMNRWIVFRLPETSSLAKICPAKTPKQANIIFVAETGGGRSRLA